MRARYPDRAGFVERDGIRLGYEVFGEGDPTVLLLPTWTIVHSRFWKMQVPHLARYYRVVTYDGPGNGRSDRVTDPARYTAESYAADAVAVMDEVGVETAAVVGLSLGAAFAVRLAALHPERVLGIALIGPALPFGTRAEGRERIEERFERPYPADPQGWDKYNAAYWRDHYGDFVSFFFDQCFSEPHSTKQIEDAIGWALETDPEVLIASHRASVLGVPPDELFDGVDCPVLVVHGTDDRIRPYRAGVETASRSGGTLVTMEGSGHIPNARDPVFVDLALQRFIDGLVPASESTDVPPAALWTRGLDRRHKVLILSSPIGLGHVRRDLAIADELRRLGPGVEIEWLAQHPVTAALEKAGEVVHPASERLVSESAHIASEARSHDLHCFQALRRMDEILLANFMTFQEVVDEGLHDLVVADEAWDVDHYWHENPELKRTALAWLTDFVGYLPMPEGGEQEAFLTADYNAEMIEHIARFPRIRDRAIFVGNPDDVVPDVFGPGLPKIRDWTEEHFRFSGYVTGFIPPDEEERRQIRRELGWREGEKVCIVAVGGSGVGEALLRRAVDAFPLAREAVPELRMIAVAGPRIDPSFLPTHPGLEMVGYVDRLYRLLAASDLAVVQGGLTTTMELAASKRPFIYFPLANHFEQNFHVRHRLDQYGAGRHMDYYATNIDDLAEAIARHVGEDVAYRDVETDGAARAGALIAELI
ncbi:MAG TPA: alpha/beta fold hydrolase [Acidimicrobiia bacterium]|jgi:pimeloyl-ACP methyl ester carboxylesterase/predicted glycosyltransferase